MLLRAVQSLKKFEIFLVVLLVMGAAWLRFGNVVNLPGGFHGDEAVVGLEGQHILSVGSIGPYSPLAMGQPSGPLYLTALSVRFFGPTVWAVRSVSALLGTLTVLLFYFLLRRTQGRKIALVGTALLATLDWHIHFSREGFPLISWPLCAVAAAFAALEAVRRRQARWWGITGLLTGAGIYSYNAHILFILALGLWFVFYLAREREVAPRLRVGWFFCFVATVVLVAVPMLRYAFDPANDYFSHTRAVSIFSSPDPVLADGGPGWSTMTGNSAKATYLVKRYFRFWNNLSFHSQIDSVDATGIQPVVPFLILALAAIGLVLTRKSARNELTRLSLWCCLFLPLGPVITINGYTRRAFALAPFLAFLAALGLIELWKWAYQPALQEATARWRRIAATGGVGLLCVLVMGQSLHDYFKVFAESPSRAWILAQDFSDMCVFLKTLPPESQVSLYSERWSCNYEPRRFLVPAVAIQDRSSEFGTFSLRREPEMKHPIFVLMGPYSERLPELLTLYPQSRVQNGPPSAETGKPAFIAVWPTPKNALPSK